MQLYYIHTLKPDNNNTIPQDWLPLPDERAVKALETEYISDIRDLKWKVILNQEFTKATLQLWGTYTKPQYKQTGMYILFSCILSSTEVNCGAVHLSNINNWSSLKQRTGFTTHVLNNCVLAWVKRAGYGFVYGNTAGTWQNIVAGGMLAKAGFSKFGKKYRNPRSGNTNIWWSRNLNRWKLIPYGA